MMPPFTLVGAVRGEVMTRAREPFMVLARCEYRSVGYFCETCQTSLANVGELVLHLEAGGAHRVAVNCPKHGGLLEAVDPAQIEALQGRAA